MAGRLKFGILISGRGSNMLALIEACQDPGFPAETSVVISNCPDAPGLKKAAQAGIPAEIVDHKNFKNKAAFEQALDETLRRHKVEFICLAGFMRILSENFIRGWPERIINIHPSLLPDYKGLDTHARVLADKRDRSGCTVHYVIPEMDSGPVILQKTVPIRPEDTPEILAARILEQEHLAYPEAVRMIAKRIGN